MDGQGNDVVGRRVGRYVLYDPIASGGMATVHFGRMLGPVGFARTVAIKRLHPHFARDPEFVAMFLDEARLAARVQHPNVVATLDIVAAAGEVFLVMDYVKGESLAGLLRILRGDATPVPPAVIAAIVVGVLHGLQAAHDARSDRGEPLQIVHRDVSPQNVLVGEDGVARLADFGVARAASRLMSTQGGKLKGKIAYMAPEQVSLHPVDHRADLYAAAVVLWEGLAGRRLFRGDSPASLVHEIMNAQVPRVTQLVPGIPAEVDRLIERGMARNPDARFRTALEMALSLEHVLPPASQGIVGAWVRGSASTLLEQRAQRLAVIEATPASDAPSASLAAMPAAAASPEVLGQLSNLPTRPDAAMALVPVSVGAGHEMSSISVSGEVQRTTVRRRDLRVVVASLAALAAAGLFISTRLPRHAPAGPTYAEPSASLHLEPASSVPIDPGPPLAAASASVAAAPSTTVPRRWTPPVDRGHGPPARPAASANCDPPYTLDPSSVSPDGRPLKRFKPWCL
jgi:serine/threonine-protein kinase